MTRKTYFDFDPQEFVRIRPLDCVGRIDRCIVDGGPQPYYLLRFVIDGECRSAEFYEDELQDMQERKGVRG